MAELCANEGGWLVTRIPTAVAVSRGTRLALNSSGLVAAAAIGVRGDYIAATDMAASEPGAVFPMQQGIKVTAIASEAIAVADVVYSAASGLCSKTSGGGAIVVGVAVQAAAVSGDLFEVQLENPV